MHVQGLTSWEHSNRPFTQAAQQVPAWQLPSPAADQPLPDALLAASRTPRGLVVIGQAGPGEAAGGLRLASLLGWPCIPDVLSGTTGHPDTAVLFLLSHNVMIFGWSRVLYSGLPHMPAPYAVQVDSMLLHTAWPFSGLGSGIEGQGCVTHVRDRWPAS